MWYWYELVFIMILTSLFWDLVPKKYTLRISNKITKVTLKLLGFGDNDDA